MAYLHRGKVFSKVCRPFILTWQADMDIETPGGDAGQRAEPEQRLVVAANIMHGQDHTATSPVL